MSWRVLVVLAWLLFQPLWLLGLVALMLAFAVGEAPALWLLGWLAAGLAPAGYDRLAKRGDAHG